MITKIKRVIKNPKIAVMYMLHTKIGRIIPDIPYLKLTYRLIFGKKLNLDNPMSFNEKLQWLKINDRDSKYTQMVDKYAAKEYVASIIGEQHIIPTIGVWDSFEDIDFDELPLQFVLKTTHDSGSVIVCKNKNELNLKETKQKLKNSLKRKYFWYWREWPYKNVPNRILAEKYMEDQKFSECLNVYKIFCFNGVPKIFQVIQNDKTREETIDYFDTDWNLLDLKQNYPNSEKALPKPEKLEEMLNIARQLSDGHPFLRVDLYEINGNVYFSELTFFSDAGNAKFEPEEWDYTLGSWITL